MKRFLKWLFTDRTEEIFNKGYELGKKHERENMEMEFEKRKIQKKIQKGWGKPTIEFICKCGNKVAVLSADYLMIVPETILQLKCWKCGNIIRYYTPK